MLFDDDPVGSVLSYGLAIPGPGIERTDHRQRWFDGNVKGHQPWEHVWAGPAMSRETLLNVLKPGRDGVQLRKTINRVFRRLESRHLVDPLPSDDNIDTPYRVVNQLGRELLDDRTYTEFLGGPRVIVERWRSSVVKLHRPGHQGVGSGFLVAPNLVATAAHVTQGLGEFEVVLEDGTVVPHGGVTYPGVDWLDLALVHLVEPLLEVTPFRLSLSRDLLDEVVVFGFPPVPRSDDAYLVVSKGEISALVTLYDPRDLQAIITSSLLRGGNSGGPVVNARGEVIGVVSENLFQHLNDGDNINEGLGFSAATPAEWLRDLINGDV